MKLVSKLYPHEQNCTNYGYVMIAKTSVQHTKAEQALKKPVKLLKNPRFSIWYHSERISGERPMCKIWEICCCSAQSVVGWLRQDMLQSKKTYRCIYSHQAMILARLIIIRDFRKPNVIESMISSLCSYNTVSKFFKG